MPKTDKRDEIVLAALELIAEQGFRGAPMAELAKRGGVGVGKICRHFENKDVLIAKLFAEVENRMKPAQEQYYAPSAPVSEGFLHIGTALLRYFIENPLDSRYLEQSFNSP